MQKQDIDASAGTGTHTVIGGFQLRQKIELRW